MNSFLTQITWERVFAVLTLLATFYAAYSARKKVNSDLNAQAIEAASKSVTLRERDIDYLVKENRGYVERVAYLRDYIDYLWVWIKEVKTKKSHPKALEEFTVRAVDVIKPL